MSGKRQIQEREETAVSRKAVRYGVPVAVVGITAATIGLVPAFAGSGSPDLPEVSAQGLIAKIAASDVRQLSGTAKITTDLGLPGLPGLDVGGLADQVGGGADGKAGADPRTRLTELATGTHVLRVAADGPDKHRLTVMNDADEYTVVHNGDEVWAYDSATGAAYHATSPEGEKAGERGERHTGPAAASPQELARRVLDAVDDTTAVTVDGTTKVAGRDAYQLLVEPKQAHSTVGSVRIAVDARHGVPLKVTLSPKSGGKPILDAGFTSVDFAEPDTRTFTFTPPKGAEVTEQREQDKQDEHGTGAREKAADGLAGLLPGLSGAGAGADAKAGTGAGGGAEAGNRSGGAARAFGEGWATVVQLKAPSGRGSAAAHSGELPSQAGKFLDSLTEKATGKFGSGRIFSTRLVNALLTDDGAVYVGAVDKSALVKAADEAAAKAE
ncbi:outer membrane lipoprotein carrier protein LolA [Streptomyces pathocidini]|uniref:Outer membrane lipoprotein carrier protein LolA n=2 Tax=Streptomyces pathocidini TaxID=1650571 RepID=A0ABW7UWC4_9ACTN